MLNIVLFGPPGAGKGTQSARIIERYNLLYISTGELLRKEMAAQTELGIEAKRDIDKGELVPDALVVEIMEKFIDDNPKANGILFDGYPRTVSQAHILEDLLKKRGTKLHYMLSLEVPKDVLLERLLHRGEFSGRSDDKKEVILNRFREYEEKTAAVAEYYKETGLYTPIKGTGSLDEIFENLTAVIDSALIDSTLINSDDK